MDIRICGIPAKVSVIHFDKGYPAKVNADPDDCYEAEGPAVSFRVLDRNGRHAPWLEAKMTDADVQRVEAELIAGMR